MGGGFTTVRSQVTEASARKAVRAVLESTDMEKLRRECARGTKFFKQVMGTPQQSKAAVDALYERLRAKI